MSSVFSTFIQRVIVCLLLLTAASEASECGEVRFSHELGNGALLRLFEIDNKPIPNKVDHTNKYSSYNIMTGTRVFHVIEESKELYSDKKLARWHKKKLPKFKSLRANRAKKLKPYYDKQVHHYLSVEIKKGGVYSFSLNSNKQVELSSIENAECHDISRISLENKKTLSISLNELPESLKTQVMRYAIKDKSNKVQNTTSFVNHYRQASLYSHFGLIMDDVYGENGGIKVLTSEPNSLAFNMGIRSNDEIIEVEGKRVQKNKMKPLHQFEELVRDVVYYSTLDVELLRNGTNMKLDKKIQPIVIPTNWLTYEGNSFVSSDPSYKVNKDKLEFNYASLLLSLWDYFDSQYSNYHRIEINAVSDRNRLLGISGKAINGVGLSIAAIEDDSPLNTVGLVFGDTITSFGQDDNGVADVKGLVNYILTLEDSEKIVLNILRNGVKQKLVGDYNESLIPSFKLLLDLESVQLAQKNIRKYIRESLDHQHFNQAHSMHKMRFGRSLQGNALNPSRKRKHYSKNDHKPNKRSGS